MNAFFAKQSTWYLILISSLLVLCLIFQKSLVYMVATWGSEEYSHGYLIPAISAWLVWENKAAFNKLNAEGNWAGLLLVSIGLLLGLAGELSSVFTLTQYAFLLTAFGFCIACLGWSGGKLLAFPFAYLIFMIPLPNFLYNNLSSYLQLLSSSLGVAVIRWFGISVFLEGNVIDLGNYQLQVVDACSGLRYLFPLSSFGFLCAYFFRAPFWMRLVVFLSTLPITVLLNSFRIGVIGVLVDRWGTAQAEGFLHDFEGWVIFMVCLGILFVEMWLLNRFCIGAKSFAEVFIVGPPQVISDSDSHQLPVNGAETERFPKPFVVACVLLILAMPLAWSIGDRLDLKPTRTAFNQFPLHVQDWRGVEVNMAQKFIDTLKFDDYIIANYKRVGVDVPVNFYVAYYASQRQGVSAHSPKSCIPADGWRIGAFAPKAIPGLLGTDGSPLQVNRALISKSGQQELVYYWFQQRGRVITNEYAVKWYLFWDALTRQRTDGALVRLVTPLADTSSIEAADLRLEQFLQAVVPQLVAYVPN